MADILFYRSNERPYGAFSNLFRRSVVFEGFTFPSAEHAYQFGKARDPKVAKWLLEAPSPALLAKAAHQLTRAWEVKPGWSRTKVDRMRNVLRAKFRQHLDLWNLLTSTEPHRLVEAGTIDDASGRFWGCTHRPVLMGCRCKNTLGVLLMEVRAELLAVVPEPRAKHVTPLVPMEGRHGV